MPVSRRASRAARLVAAAIELLMLAGAVWLAFWLWPRGVTTITTILDDGTTLVSTRYYGNWMALAIAAGTVAALLAVDAVRHVVLTTRHR